MILNLFTISSSKNIVLIRTKRRSAQPTFDDIIVEWTSCRSKNITQVQSKNKEKMIKESSNKMKKD